MKNIIPSNAHLEQVFFCLTNLWQQNIFWILPDFYKFYFTNKYSGLAFVRFLLQKYPVNSLPVSYGEAQYIEQVMY